VVLFFARSHMPAACGLKRHLCAGDQIEVLDGEGFWYPAHVLQVQEHAVLIHYDGWPADDDEWVPTASERLREHLGWGSERMPSDYQEGSLIDALDLEGKWWLPWKGGAEADAQKALLCG
jgi:hypothetical protein